MYTVNTLIKALKEAVDRNMIDGLTMDSPVFVNIIQEDSTLTCVDDVARVGLSGGWDNDGKAKLIIQGEV